MSFQHWCTSNIKAMCDEGLQGQVNTRSQGLKVMVEVIHGWALLMEAFKEPQMSDLENYDA